MPRAGFSLIETLIVTALIIIVLAFSFPVYRSIRTASQAVKCVANLRTIHSSILAFAADYNRRLPPPLGPKEDVDPRFNHNQYWYQQAYVAHYAIGPEDRRRDSLGKLTLDEGQLFNCPARDKNEEPDLDKNQNPTTSYLMPTLFKQQDFILGNLEPSRILLTEGRGGIMAEAGCKTGKTGSNDKTNRLRRYHQNRVHVLYHDGHVEAFSGTDEELAQKLPPRT